MVQSKPALSDSKAQLCPTSSPFHSHRGCEQWGGMAVSTSTSPRQLLPPCRYPFASCLGPIFTHFSVPPAFLGVFFTNSGSGHWLFLFQLPQQGAMLLQPEHQKTNYKNAEIAWREGPALGCERRVIWAADGCQRLPASHTPPDGQTRRQALLCDSIIKQAHPGSSSSANTKEKNEDSGHYLAHELSLRCGPQPVSATLPRAVSLLSNYSGQPEREYAPAHVLSWDSVNK